MEKRKLTCPYCGSEKVIELSPEEKEQFNQKYKCQECEWLFDEDDQLREEIRHKVSLLLDGTDIDNTLKCDIRVGEDIACGLSSLELPRIDECHQIPGEGTMWFHMAGEVPDTWHDFDWFSMSDIKAILEELENMKNNSN